MRTQNIDLDKHTTNVKMPIENYESYLQNKLKASNVIARIGRYYTYYSATITEAEYIRFLSGLNPSETGRFWLGSSESMEAYRVHIVNSDGSISYDRIYYTDRYGVRPVIIITLP